ncbi:MAG TPA: (2Fe-2S)-binding protein [Gammaproteobacteria bacterium]|nr:(2Fe-2S)-binding protein [Gammaproteobacteria bacterium]
MYVCICNKVTDSDIRRELDNGACSLACLQKRLKVASCCGRCKECAKRLLHESISIRLATEMQSAAA